MQNGRILVLGIGNVLWADEGFGVRCVEQMARRYDCAEPVELVDGGTQGLYLLPRLQEARRCIVFDAVDFGLEPGERVSVRDAEIPRFIGVRKMSLHQSSFQEVLALAQLSGRFPESMLLLGVQPADISDYGGSLTDRVRAQLDPVIETAVAQLRDWGAQVDSRPANLALAPTLDPSIAMATYEAGRPEAGAAWRGGDARVVNAMLGTPEGAR